ncbi:MAG: hypothetical protein ACLGSD_07325 [Acidobacteriota bacterium]
MKILRSVTRRGFTVGTAGWFTVTSPTRWFAASRLPRASRYLSEEFQTIPSARTAERPISHTGSGETAAPRIMALQPLERSPMRQVLAVLTAITITLGMLCWIVLAR